MSKGASRASWISELLGREVVLSPRKSPDEIPAARKLWDLSHLNQNLPDLEAFHESVVLRSRKGVDLTAEIYVPRGHGPFPTILYIHGGSWCLWSAAHVRKMTMRMAARGFVVVNLNYGLAPEHPFPWAVEDSVFAARWIAENISNYNGDGSRIIVGGDSAGANLASAIIVATKSTSADIPLEEADGACDVRIIGALLLYGIFDFPLLFSKPGRNARSGTIETTWNLAYLGPNFLSVHKSPLVSPIYWHSLKDFPPSYLSCGARDALLPQTLTMAQALADADVSTTVSIVSEADHGFLMLADSMLTAERELDRILEWLWQTAQD